MVTLWDCELRARSVLAGLEDEEQENSSVLREAGYLIENAWGIDATDRYLMRDRSVTQREEQHFEEALCRRKNGEPLALIFQKKWFYSQWFFVDKTTLIPREDSETLIDMVLSDGFLQKEGGLKIVDWGTGSGCLLITLLCHLKESRGVGIDKSKEALQVAKRNGDLHGVTERVSWVCGDWSLGGIDEALKEEGDRLIVISNPPYIASGEIPSLSVGVKDHEPWLALDGGEDGLVAIRQVLRAAAGYGEDTKLFMEIGYGQKEQVEIEALTAGWYKVGCKRDGGGIVRVLAFGRGDGGYKS